jgi:hypothetical protein
MASWERHGEAHKYHKGASDSNFNPRHVGSSLRTVSMDERIEERRKLKENQKKGPLSMALSDDEEEEQVEKPAEPSTSGPSNNAASTPASASGPSDKAEPEDKAASADSTSSKVNGTKSSDKPEEAVDTIEDVSKKVDTSKKDARGSQHDVIDDEDVAAVVTEVSTKASKKTGGREVVEDLDAVAPKRKSRTSGGKEKDSGKSPQGKSPNKRVVEDLDAVAGVPVVELDDAVSPSAAAARKARRKALAAKAKAGTSKTGTRRPQVHVLE